MKSDDEREGYEVGYGKPPKSGQFKKGISGNPSGRPKKASDFGSVLIRESRTRLIVNENGRRKVITKSEALAKQLFRKALENVPAARLVLNMLLPAFEKEAEERQRAEYMANRTADELTDEELIALILANTENRAMVDKMRQEKATPLPPIHPDV